MNYDEMKAAELKALCEKRKLKVHRAKADMIKELKEFDAAQEIKDYYGDEPAPLPDGVLPASEDDATPEPQPEPESPADEHEDVWNGSLYVAHARHSQHLGDEEHEEYLRDVVAEAERRGLEHYGPPFRAADECTADFWVYAVNVR